VSRAYGTAQAKHRPPDTPNDPHSRPRLITPTPYNPPPMGRTPKLLQNRDITRRVATALERGYYQEQAAQLAGITPKTFHNYLTRGREALPKDPDGEPLPIELDTNGDPILPDTLTKKEEAYVLFLLAVTRARLSVEGEYLDALRRAAFGGELVRETVTERKLRDGESEVKTLREWSRPDVKAITWFLERSFRARWSGGQRMVLTLEVIDEAIAQAERDVGQGPPMIGG